MTGKLQYDLQYDALGISTQKEDAEKIFGEKLVSDFPFAFCIIKRDPLSPGLVYTLKMDGSGSKPVYRYIYYLETGDASILEGDAFDGLGMAAGDAGASGLLFHIVFADTIDINGFNVDKALIMCQLEKGFAKLRSLYDRFGILNDFSGGETADLPVQINSNVLNLAVMARGKEEEVIKGEIQDGDEIFGLASNGQAVWEDEENSGIQANGLTLAGNVLLHSEYAFQYPYLCHPKKMYQGRYKVVDTAEELDGLTVGKAILSPTRQWPIVFKLIIDKLKASNSLHFLHGMTMNTGGGGTKLLRLGEHIHYCKRMPTPPGIFQLIRKEGKVQWREMFEDFNCGIGVDVIGSPEGGILEKALEEVSADTNIKCYCLGKCTKSNKKKNTLSLETPYGDFRWWKK